MPRVSEIARIVFLNRIRQPVKGHRHRPRRARREREAACGIDPHVAVERRQLERHIVGAYEAEVREHRLHRAALARLEIRHLVDEVHLHHRHRHGRLELEDEIDLVLVLDLRARDGPVGRDGLVLEKRRYARRPPGIHLYGAGIVPVLFRRDDELVGSFRDLVREEEPVRPAVALCHDRTRVGVRDLHVSAC